MGVAYDLVISAHGLPNPEDVLGPVVVLGGPMGVGDMPDLDWLAREAQWIEELLARNARLLGICLGAQLTAHVLGHQVAPCPTGAMECGYYPLQATSIDHGLPSHVYHWHRDCIINTPEGAELEVLARYDWHQGRGVQAYRYGNAMGVQFHPEMTQATIVRWLERDTHHLDLPGTRPAHTHLDDHALYGQAAKAWTRQFLVAKWLLGGHLEQALTVEA